MPGGPAWYSEMNSAIPPTALRNTTATPMLPPSTSSATTTSMPTSLQGGSDSGGMGIGLGVGLGGLFVVLAILAAWYLFRIRRRASARKSASSQRSTSLHSLSWTPDMHSLRSSIVDSPATASSTCLWLGGPNAASATMREYDGSATIAGGSSRPRADTPGAPTKSAAALTLERGPNRSPSSRLQTLRSFRPRRVPLTTSMPRLKSQPQARTAPSTTSARRRVRLPSSSPRPRTPAPLALRPLTTR